MRLPTQSVFGRVVLVGFGAGLVALSLATIGTAWVVADDKEATLVEEAIRRAERSGDVVDHRVALARAELRAVALAADAGRVFEVPPLLSGSALAIRCLSATGDEVLDASSSRAAHDELLSTATPPPDGIVRSGASRFVIASRVGQVTALALYDLSDLLTAPPGWSLKLTQRSPGPVVARRYEDRGAELVRVVAPSADGLGVILTAPLAPTRRAAFAITRRVLQYASLALVPLLLMAWFLSRAVTAPIVSLAEAVRQAEGGPLALPPLPRHEVGDLGLAIGAMSARLHDNATALAATIRFGRDVGEMSDPEALLRMLEQALAEALPAARWSVLAAQKIMNGEIPAGIEPPVETLRVLLRASTVEASREEDSTAPIFVHGPVQSHDGRGDIVVVGICEGERAYGLAIGSGAGLEKATVRQAELFARTAAAALHREELMRAVVTNEKLAAVGRLAAGVAHEMNNPLAFVLANLEVLETRLTGDDREAAVEARQGAQRLARIVRDVSSLSRGTALEPEELDLAELARFAAKIASSRRQGIEVTLQAPDAVWVRVDRGRIEQVLLNLIVNAIDATRSRKDANVVVRVRVDGDDALAEVRDNGSGVPAAVQSQLFGAFFTTKGSEGTGLGLYLSRSFAQASGGDVSLASTGPDGTTFALRLPALKGAHGQSAIAAAPSTTAPARPRVLIIDDEPAIVRAMQRWLRTRADVVGTTDPHEAVALAQREQFALVLCDLHMPEMSGMDLLAELREKAPATAARVVIMTGSTQAETVHAGVRVVGKPIDAAVLKELFDAL